MSILQEFIMKLIFSLILLSKYRIFYQKKPDGEKFKEIAEAYGVLSVPESKLSYDFLNQATPDSIYREQRFFNFDI